MTALLDSRIGRGAISVVLTLAGSLSVGESGQSPQASPGSTAGLAPFSSCEALRQWYVARTIDQVGPYGWDRPMYALRELATTQDDAAASAPSAAVTNGDTGTNTQEAGIDEPDVAKTDGRIVVRIRDRRVLVTDVTGATPREVGSWTAPGATYPSGLLLVDGHALVSADEGSAIFEDRILPPGPSRGGTRLFDLDLTDPSTPTLVGSTTWEGQSLSLRQYGGVVRLVTSTGLPALRFVTPGRGIGPQRATARNREIVRTAPIERWLPWMRVDQGTSKRAVDCSRILHPETGSRTSEETTTLAVHTIRPGEARPVSSVAITGAGNDAYSSSDRLYVWSTDWNAPLVTRTGKAFTRTLIAPTTQVHAFALDGDETDYVASGRISGQVRDRWSFDEHDGHLRVAVGFPARFGTRDPDDPVSSTDASGDNGIVVLDEQDGRLTPVGSVRGLGVDEQIQSVRWFDDLAVIVTFRQTDPLYTVDVSDPSRPRVLGALKIPGFSSYLHPIGGDRLLGLGVDATALGRIRGAKVAVFDVADPAAVRRLDERRLGDETWLAAGDDAHAFTWIPAGEGTGTAVAQLDTPDDLQGSRQLAIRVGDDADITTRLLPRVGGWQPRALPLPDGRVALVGDRVAVTDVVS